VNHEFCRELLRQVRADAKLQGIVIPKGLTALSSDIGRREQWFIEAKENSPQVYVNADCAFEARAKFISKLLRTEGR
jgi:hypothetical protein